MFSAASNSSNVFPSSQCDAPRQLEARREKTHQLWIQASNVFCASNSCALPTTKHRFPCGPCASMSRRSSSRAFLIWASNSAMFLTVETLLQSLHVVVHCGTSFLATTTHTTTRARKATVFQNVSLTIAVQKIRFQTCLHVHLHRVAFFVAGSVLRSSASSSTPGRVAT